MIIIGSPLGAEQEESYLKSNLLKIRSFSDNLIIILVNAYSRGRLGLKSEP